MSDMLPVWTQSNDSKLADIIERVPIDLLLPLESHDGVTTQVISGALPSGIRLENNRLIGTAFEVSRPSVNVFVIRAENSYGLVDRTFYTVTEGADSPYWGTSAGRLPVGPSQAFFVLDSTFVDFQLLAGDDDLPSGDNLIFFIDQGSGELPPGLKLTSDGRIYGITSPLLSLEASATTSGYSATPLSRYPYDFGVSSAGNSTVGDRLPRKLNRVYEFVISVTDNVSVVRRKFEIYVVSDDFVRSDNSILRASDGVFTADTTFFRTPMWLTPSDLGERRANNYVTLYFDVIDRNTLVGDIFYQIEQVNDDGSPSRIPSGLILDPYSGELAGRIPYQPAITEEYKFTLSALRYLVNQGVVTIFGEFVEDVRSGERIVKVKKLSNKLVGATDELRILVGRDILINDSPYTVEAVSDNYSNYDTLLLKQPLTVYPNTQELTVTADSVLQDTKIFVKTLPDSDRIFYQNKSLIYGLSESYTITEVYPYIEWLVTGTKLRIGTSETANELTNYILNNLSLDATKTTFVTTEENMSGDVVQISMILPATSANRNSNLIRDLFSNSEDGYTVTSVDQYDTVFFDKPLIRVYSEFDTIGIGAIGGEGFSDSISLASTTQAKKSKTFTIKIIGEVESAVEWNTQSSLGAIPVNQISTIKLRAANLISESLLLYELESGMLPPGLHLQSNGDIVGTVTADGLTRIVDQSNSVFTDVVFDSGTTTFDRNFKFTVLAKDRFGYSGVSRSFELFVDKLPNIEYSNFYIKPYVNREVRNKVEEFFNNRRIFENEYIYRPNDSMFGIQRSLKCLVYAGLEQQALDDLVPVISKYHTRMSFKFGELQTAIARLPGTTDTIYELVYIELLDKTQNKELLLPRTQIDTKNQITADTQYYYTDVSEYNDGLTSGDPSIVEAIAYKNRPQYVNPVTADSDVVTLDQTSDNMRYISNVNKMREMLKSSGRSETSLTPLWMQTPQDSDIVELGYTLAVPLVYTIPGGSTKILENIKNSGFDFKSINYDIDRYVVENSKENSKEQYLIFANYRYNV